MTVQTTAAVGRLDIGRVIQLTFASIGQNLGPFAILALICVGVPAFFLSLSQLLVKDGNPGTGFLAIAVSGLVYLAGVYVMQAGAIHGSVAAADGSRPQAAELFRSGLRLILPLFWLALVMGLAIGLGMLLFLVPGIILFCMWAVATPVRVVEGGGFASALSRSAKLTKGSRWTIFLLGLIFFVGSMVINLVVTGVSAVTVSGGAAVGAMFAALFSALVAVALSVVGAAGAAVLYLELRRVREGVTPESLARVFD